MAGLIHGIDPAKVHANLERVRETAGEGVEILVAAKYVPLEEMGALAEAGVAPGRREPPAGPRRQARALGRCLRVGLHRQPAEPQGQAGAAALPPDPLGRDRLGAARSSASHGGPKTEVLVEVNVAGEEGKGGVAPADLPAFIERCPVRVGGLMTMPPFSQDPEASRPHFARLAELAAANGLARLSMGTSQDWPVAVEEGATIVRLGTALFV